MINLESNGLRWFFTFLATDTRLSKGDKLYLMLEATDMCYHDESRRKIEGDNYEGLIRLTKKDQLFVTFIGNQYHAELNVDNKRINLSFMVSEQTSAKYSRN